MAEDLEVEDLYDGLIDLLDEYISEEVEELMHYGVKGMKWGVRKSDPPVSPTGNTLKKKDPDSVVTLKNGDTITLEGRPSGKLLEFMARRNPSKIDEYNDRSSFKIRDKNGKKVGNLQLRRDDHDPKALNVVWVGIDKSARGKGYATAVMKSAIQHAKNKKFKAVTLEVPGNAPDARHIYEKLGFKEVYTPPEMKAYDPVWGGLTNMRRELGGEKSDEIKHYGVKGMKWGVRKARTGDLNVRATRQETIAKGEGTKLQKTVAALNTPFSKLVQKDGVKKHAADRAKALRDEEERLATGKAKVSDILKAYGSANVYSLVGAANKRTDHELKR